MPARRRQRGTEAPVPNRAVEGRLADPEQPGGLTGGDESRAGRLVLEAGGKSDDVPFAEPAMSPWGDERGMQESSCHRTQDSRLAHAETSCHILRTDQSVQDVCWSNAA